jgi:hypothetical protein
MCELLARKMHQAIQDFKKDVVDETSFEAALCADKKQLALWITILAQVELEKGNTQASEDLAHSVSFITNKQIEIKSLNVQETLGFLKKTESSWFMEHYKRLAEKSDLIGVCYALEKVYKHYASLKDNASTTTTQEISLQIQRNFEAIL